MTTSRYTEAMKDDMVSRHVDGRQNLTEIGRVYGCTREYVRQIMLQRGVATLTLKRQAQLKGMRRFMRAVSYVAWRTANEDRHGQHVRYLMGCRCEACKDANRVYHLTLRDRPAPRHGTASSYVNYACRCAPCKEAGARNNKAIRDRRKERELGLV